METLLGIVRTPEGLAEYRSRRLQEVVFEDYEASPAGELGRLYETVKVPCGDARLVRAWEALAEGWDEAGVRLILAETVPDPRAPYRRFEPPRPVVKPRPTAAHPRAYRGTQVQPPKPPQPYIDVRPCLASVGGTAEGRRYLALPPAPETWPLLPAVEGWLEVYWALELGRRRPLREAVVRLASLLQASERPRRTNWTAPEHLDGAPSKSRGAVQKAPHLGPDWCLALLDVPARHRAFVLTCLIEGGAYRRPVVSLAGLDLHKSSRRALWFAYCLGDGACPEILRARLRLRGDWPLPRVAATAAPNPQVLARRPQTVDFWSLWYQAPRLAASEGWRLLDDVQANQALWAFEKAPDEVGLGVLAALAAVPSEYRRKFVSEFHGERLDLIEVMLRVCRPPFAAWSRMWQPWPRLARRLTGERRRRWLAAPDASFLTIEKACHRDNEAFLIGGGLERLARHEPDFLLETWEQHPRPLARLAELLGTLHPDLWRRVRQRWREHVLLGDLGDQDLLTAIETHLPHTAPHRIPAGLRKGKPHWDRLRENLLLCQLDLLAELARQGLHEDLPGADLYAAQLAGTIDDNRRALRRALRRQAEHPENVRWLRQHPRLDVELWTQGFEDRHPDITLRIESDPLEVLKMGHYAGSCLSLGGGIAYSSAAVMLDVNKQVVYARDTQGRVKARQLLAISRAGELVPFYVYPAGTPHWLARLLRDYHRELARRLGLPLCTHDGYEVEQLAAEGWWDDGRSDD